MTANTIAPEIVQDDAAVKPVADTGTAALTDWHIDLNDLNALKFASRGSRRFSTLELRRPLADHDADGAMTETDALALLRLEERAAPEILANGAYERLRRFRTADAEADRAVRLADARLDELRERLRCLKSEPPPDTDIAQSILDTNKDIADAEKTKRDATAKRGAVADTLREAEAAFSKLVSSVTARHLVPVRSEVEGKIRAAKEEIARRIGGLLEQLQPLLRTRRRMLAQGYDDRAAKEVKDRILTDMVAANGTPQAAQDASGEQ
jgi:hypothetical protein